MAQPKEQQDGKGLTLDDEAVLRVEFRKRMDEGERRYDLEFTHSNAAGTGTTTRSLKDLDRDAMVDAIGERNANTIDARKGASGVLKGKELEADYGLSPQEQERRMQTKEDRKAVDAEAMGLEANTVEKPKNIELWQEEYQQNRDALSARAKDDANLLANGYQLNDLPEHIKYAENARQDAQHFTRMENYASRLEADGYAPDAKERAQLAEQIHARLEHPEYRKTFEAELKTLDNYKLLDKPASEYAQSVGLTPQVREAPDAHAQNQKEAELEGEFNRHRNVLSQRFKDDVRIFGSGEKLSEVKHYEGYAQSDAQTWTRALQLSSQLSAIKGKFPEATQQAWDLVDQMKARQEHPAYQAKFAEELKTLEQQGKLAMPAAKYAELIGIDLDRMDPAREARMQQARERADNLQQLADRVAPNQQAGQQPEAVDAQRQDWRNSIERDDAVELDPAEVRSRAALARNLDRSDSRLNALGAEASERTKDVAELGAISRRQENLNLGMERTGELPNIEGRAETDRVQAHRAEVLAQVHREFRTTASLSGVAYHHKGQPEKVAFAERGTRLATNSNDQRVAAGMAALAEARGWKSIKVNGHPDFRREVWMEAQLRGINVRGFTPHEHDLRELQERRDRSMQNTVEKTSEKSTADREKSSGHKVAEAVASKMVAHALGGQSPAVQAAVMERFNQRLEQGEKAAGRTPTVQVYDKNAPSQTKGTERIRPQVERNTERTR